MGGEIVFPDIGFSSSSSSYFLFFFWFPIFISFIFAIRTFEARRPIVRIGPVFTGNTMFFNFLIFHCFLSF